MFDYSAGDSAAQGSEMTTNENAPNGGFKFSPEMREKAIAAARQSAHYDGAWKYFVDQPKLHTKPGIQATPASQLIPANAKVSAIQFGLLKSSDVLKMSHMEVTHRNFYQPHDRREPVPYGVLDRRLGTSEKGVSCATCHKPLVDCIGHFGHIELELPVFHIGYIKEIQRVLHMICKTCSRVLIHSEAFREYYLSKISLSAGRAKVNQLRYVVCILSLHLDIFRC